ncbi:hypothetical protein BKI52_08955 [marine bacterium AO1-C]|nr:hypothetical protein BKI52_08955 [marine bacterium AO1-C]
MQLYWASIIVLTANSEGDGKKLIKWLLDWPKNLLDKSNYKLKDEECLYKYFRTLSNKAQ